MQSPAGSIIQNSTGMIKVVFLYFPLYLFTTKNIKNTWIHVEKARKGPGKAGNVQRVTFISASSSLHTLDLW